MNNKYSQPEKMLWGQSLESIKSATRSWFIGQATKFERRKHILPFLYLWLMKCFMLFISLFRKFQRNKPAQANGVSGLNGRTVHEFVEEERVKGIAFVTIQHHPMEDKTVLGTDWRKRPVKAINVQVNHNERLHDHLMHNKVRYSGR